MTGTLFLCVAGVTIVILFSLLKRYQIRWDEKMWIRSNKAWRRFEETYPPISDEEFMRRLGPGHDPKIALRVREIIAQQTGYEIERIYPEMNLSDMEYGYLYLNDPEKRPLESYGLSI